MTDDIVTLLREVAVQEHKDGWAVFPVCDRAANEIERLQTVITELVKTFKQVGIVAEMWQKTEDELIELHHAKCAERFAEQHKEIERLQAEVRRLQGVTDGL